MVIDLLNAQRFTYISSAGPHCELNQAKLASAHGLRFKTCSDMYYSPSLLWVAKIPRGIPPMVYLYEVPLEERSRNTAGAGGIFSLALQKVA